MAYRKLPPGIACDLCCLIVPLIYVPLDVDAKDGSVGGIDQLTELMSSSGDGAIMLGCFRNILSNPNH